MFLKTNSKKNFIKKQLVIYSVSKLDPTDPTSTCPFFFYKVELTSELKEIQKQLKKKKS